MHMLHQCFLYILAAYIVYFLLSMSFTHLVKTLLTVYMLSKLQVSRFLVFFRFHAF